MNVNNDVSIYEHLPSRTFIKLFTMPYKKQGKASELVSEVQSALYEGAVYLKGVIVVWRSSLQRSVE